jgi:hypothetical protein
VHVPRKTSNEIENDKLVPCKVLATPVEALSEGEARSVYSSCLWRLLGHSLVSMGTLDLLCRNAIVEGRRTNLAFRPVYSPLVASVDE